MTLTYKLVAVDVCYSAKCLSVIISYIYIDTHQFFKTDGIRVDKLNIEKAMMLSDLLDQRIVQEWDPASDIHRFKELHFEQLCVEHGVVEDIERDTCVSDSLLRNLLDTTHFM